MIITKYTNLSAEIFGNIFTEAGHILYHGIDAVLKYTIWLMETLTNRGYESWVKSGRPEMY